MFHTALSTGLHLLALALYQDVKVHRGFLAHKRRLDARMSAAPMAPLKTTLAGSGDRHCHQAAKTGGVAGRMYLFPNQKWMCLKKWDALKQWTYAWLFSRWSCWVCLPTCQDVEGVFGNVGGIAF